MGSTLKRNYLRSMIDYDIINYVNKNFHCSCAYKIWNGNAQNTYLRGGVKTHKIRIGAAV